jgi:outer membrane protein OmpA-like peptidoglycan-associated protein
MIKKTIVSIIASAACFLLVAQQAATQASAVFTPSQNLLSTRGLNMVHSAEVLGEGRLSFTLSSAWYMQKKDFVYAPNKGADVITGTLSTGFGVSSFFDIYLALSGYGISGYSRNADNGGLGTFRGGIQGRLPLPDDLPFFLGARVSILGGTSGNQINNNRADGYNYFETRTGYDFEAIVMQTIRFGNEGKCAKLHLNEGSVVTLQDEKDHLLLLGMGLQYDPHKAITIGVEINSRTSMSDPEFATDPLILTPQLQFHTPVNMEFTLGGNISLSNDRDSTRALEPFRFFAGISASFDMLASKRKFARERQVKDSLDRENEHKQRESAESKNIELQAKADSIAQKARIDSLQLVQQREKERLRADSIAAKAKTDSIQLVEARKKLEEEKSKRTDAEKQLLSTGLLLLDAVYFETGKSDISINSEPYLMIISKMLLKYPKLLIEVGGHTDNVGSMSKNMSLSQARAEAVKYFLIQSSPELSNRITARGYGSSRPKANNSYAEGRKVNRRVELQVLNKDVLSEYNK